ncbi:hypothetical protein F503_04769 [Ophiostoma piceae UAMH 11346]|uniref:ABM domain-containing protein n=1 Tax=Ophiostoma piceae (strain UAMH 11346) TaxID=1262450 RepID=S3BSN0_OPHP1|nr:hypothetical protein F503_04769 [Ophiostoma piceae UAMH 11346]
MSIATQDDKLYLFAFVHFLPGAYNSWQAAYDELAVHVWAHEPTTETYYFGLPLDFIDDVANTPAMLAFEVYDTRDSLYNVHFVSEAMARGFLPKAVPNMMASFDLQHYSRVAGFLDKPGDARACGFMYDVKIECKSSDARGRILARLRELGPKVEASELTARGALLTWMGFASQDSDKDARIFMRFRDKAAFQEYVRLQDVAGFWAAGKDEDIDKVQQRGYVENGRGWLHR